MSNQARTLRKETPKDKPETRKVVLRTGMAGHVTDPETGKPKHGFTRNPGDTVDLPIEEADRYVERGYAVEPEDA